jgi:hypothetical protein
VKRRKQKGTALLYVMMLMAFLLPMLLVLSSRLEIHGKHNLTDRKIRFKRMMSDNLLSDYLRQFSEDFRQNHYSKFWLDHGNIFIATAEDLGFTGGSTRLKVNSDVSPLLTENTVRSNNIFVMNTFGAYGSDLSNLSAGEETIIQFRQNALRYAFVSTTLAPITINGNHPLAGTTLNGGAWWGGPINVTGGWTINQGPFVAMADVNGGATLSLIAGTTFYYSPSATVGGVTGGLQVGYLPPETALNPGLTNLDLSYYETHYTTHVTVDSVWTFYKRTAAEQSRFRDQSGVDFSLPVASSFPVILLIENANLTLKTENGGNLSGWGKGLYFPITIVAINGDITIDGNFKYQDIADAPTTASSPKATLGILAGRNLIFKNSAGASMDVVGYYYVKGQVQLDGTSDVHLHGGLYTDSGQIVNTGPVKHLTITADPDMRKNTPPGFPEQAVLVKHRPLK